MKIQSFFLKAKQKKKEGGSKVTISNGEVKQLHVNYKNILLE